MPARAIPAPVGGWNARDSVDQMPETDAVRMVNIIPRAGYCETRKGFIRHATGLGGAVETLVSYRGAASEKMIAAANGQLWDVTSATPSSLKSLLTNNRWQDTHHSGRMILTNGADTPQVYDGATMADISVTGVTATTLWGCATFKGRVYYWAKNAQSFWYPAAGAYQGALTQFTLAGQLSTGGSLIQMVTWTLDSGEGVDDLAVFIFSTGEVLVYQGDDPGSAAAWSLVGRFQIGEPLGIRAHAKVGGTEIILTRDGYVDLAAALKDGRYTEKSAYSHKIIRAAKTAAANYHTQFGWEAILYPVGQMFIVNVPLTDVQAQQHVRSTNSGGWCEFRDMDARTFAVHNNLLYFGGSDGVVYQADIGAQDVDQPIELDCITAYSSLGSRANRKQVTAVNVVSNYAYPAYFAIDMLGDFSTTRRSSLTPGPYTPASGWDTESWDAADWDIGTEELQATRTAWRNASGIGYVLATSLRGSTRSQNIIWYSTSIQYRNAGVI